MKREIRAAWLLSLAVAIALPFAAGIFASTGTETSSHGYAHASCMGEDCHDRTSAECAQHCLERGAADVSAVPSYGTGFAHDAAILAYGDRVADDASGSARIALQLGPTPTQEALGTVIKRE